MVNKGNNDTSQGGADGLACVMCLNPEASLTVDVSDVLIWAKEKKINGDSPRAESATGFLG
jgi:hypothetical protein